jgi:hypothetical protein
MQKLSGVITESQYNQKIEELNSQTLNENQLQGVESFLKSKGYKIEDVKGSMEAKEREGEFASGMDVDQDPNSAKKNNKAFISKIPLIQDGVKSFMVFVPRYSPQGKDNEPLRDEMRKKFGGVDPETGAFMISLVIPFESNISETLNENVVGIGSVLNPYPTKKKEVYEAAFSKFLGEEKEKELEEGGDYYEGPVDEDQEEVDDAKKALDKKEDELDKSEEDNESLEDRIKHHEDAIKNIKKELADLHKDLGEDEDDKKEEEKEKKGEVDEAVDMAEEALNKLREEETEKEKKERDGRYDGGESVETERTEDMKDMGRD